MERNNKVDKPETQEGEAPVENIIDATDSVIGRLASIVAKELLKGKSICIVNAEKAVIMGNTPFIIEDFMSKIKRGDPYHGPFYPRRPDMILKRIVRGMLPYKKPNGRKALKRLKVFMSVPNELKSIQTVKIKEAENKSGQKFITMNELSDRIGFKTLDKKRI